MIIPPDWGRELNSMLVQYYSNSQEKFPRKIPKKTAGPFNTLPLFSPTEDYCTVQSPSGIIYFR